MLGAERFPFGEDAGVEDCISFEIIASSFVEGVIVMVLVL